MKSSIEEISNKNKLDEDNILKSIKSLEEKLKSNSKNTNIDSLKNNKSNRNLKFSNFLEFSNGESKFTKIDNIDSL